METLTLTGQLSILSGRAIGRKTGSLFLIALRMSRENA